MCQKPRLQGIYQQKLYPDKGHNDVSNVKDGNQEIQFEIGTLENIFSFISKHFGENKNSNRNMKDEKWENNPGSNVIADLKGHGSARGGREADSDELKFIV